MTVGDDVLKFGYDANGSPMYLQFNNSRYFYATNLQGDVMALIHTSGTAVVEYTYDAWGNILTITGSMADTVGQINPLRYRGYVYDVETRLYYLQSRYYDPTTGRFLNADALVSTGQGLLGNNMFAYCGNNPVNRFDPSGKSYIDWDLLPNYEAGKAFAEWYINSDENETDEHGNLTLNAKLKSTVRAMATSIEFVSGIGLGMYFGVSAAEYANANFGIYYDLIRVQYIDGGYAVCQYGYQGLDANLFQIIVFSDMSQEYRRSSLLGQDRWEEVSQDDVISLFGIGGYFFGGFTLEANWDVLGFLEDISNIWSK